MSRQNRNILTNLTTGSKRNAWSGELSSFNSMSAVGGTARARRPAGRPCARACSVGFARLRWHCSFPWPGSPRSWQSRSSPASPSSFIASMVAAIRPLQQLALAAIGIVAWQWQGPRRQIRNKRGMKSRLNAGQFGSLEGKTLWAGNKSISTVKQ
jgi:hypothetical protein